MDTKKLQKELGKLIKTYRETKGLTQEELSFECDLYRTQISLIERGLKNIQFSTLIKIVTVLNIPVDSLESFKQYYKYVPEIKS